MAKTKLPEAAPDGGKTISARDAVLAATTYFAEVAGNTSGVSVEEIELTDDGKFWLVTLGVVVPLVKTSAFGPTGPGAYGLGEVAYKVFKVDARTAEVKSMKLRNLG